MSRRTFTAVTTGVAVALLMSGCIGGPDSPTSTVGAPSATSAPAGPTTEPVDPLTTVTTIVARPEMLELRDAGGSVIEALEYMGSVDHALATLAVVLGGSAVDEPYAGGNHNPPGVRHSWDDALVVAELLYDEQRRVDEGLDSLEWPRLAVTFRTAEVRGIDLTTSTDAHPGDAVDALSPEIDPDLWTCTGWAVETIELLRPEYGPVQIGVGVSTLDLDESSETYGQQIDEVTAIHAPVPVAEGCA